MKETLTLKQQKRNEKKKRKLTALANLMDLNDKDRLHAAESAKRRESLVEYNEEPESTTSPVVAHNDDNDDGFVTVSSKRKSRNQLRKKSHDEEIAKSDKDEPETKRSRILLNSASGDDTPDTLSDDQYKSLSAELRKRKRFLQNSPALRLREMGERASLETPHNDRTPIFLTDIQHLLMAALIGRNSPCAPDRWCSIDKMSNLTNSSLFIIEGISLYDYLTNESRFEATNKIFNTKLEVLLPPYGDGHIIDEIAQIPLTNVQANKLIDEYGSLESAVELIKDPTLLVKAIFPVEKQEPLEKMPLHPEDKFPRTKLLLSALQMVDEGYPMPLQGELHNRFKSYMFTKSCYAPVTNQSPMFGVDCEMCRTVAGVNELTRISIVNEKFETVYETLVRPFNKITDYLTQYSGITPELLKTCTKTLSEVQREVSKLLPPDAILVGQSLNSDLNAMKMMHPYVIDTSVCFNASGVRKRKSKLKYLAQKFLQEDIQINEDGHDSIEDSLATLKLVKMKLANSIEFGDEILIQRKRMHEVVRASTGGNIKNNLLAHVAKGDKRTAIVTVGDLQPRLKEVIQNAEQAASKDGGNANSKAVNVHTVSTTKEAVRKVGEIAMENALTITSLMVTEQELTMESVEHSIAKLDKTIKRLWDTVAHNGLFVVLMGGSMECSKGLAKIAIKRPNGTEALNVPLDV